MQYGAPASTGTQVVSPDEHTRPQVPPLHTSPAAHALLHAWQLFGSVSRLVQTLVDPDAQRLGTFGGHAQLPPEHTCPPGQGCLHPPQLAWSVCVFAQ